MYDIYQRPRGYNKGGRLRTDVCPTITESDWQQNCFLIEEFSQLNISSTVITKINFEDRTIKSYAIRKFTPFECFRLMGVRDDVIKAMQSNNARAAEFVPEYKGKGMPEDMAISASQQYKMAGNSIVVDVLVNIFENLFYPPKENIIREEDGVIYKVQDNGQISFF